MKATNIGVIGCGYWGPNLLRNFAENEDAQLRWICDIDEDRLASMSRRYPMAQKTTAYDTLVSDPALDAVAVVTPVATHYTIARELLRAGKHVLLEKPLAATAREAEELIDLAEMNELTLMVDHTFIYTGAVRKMGELIHRGDLGKIFYYDSIRVNLGLFQRDVNVISDLAVHDFAILDYLLREHPTAVSASGLTHFPGTPENLAYITLFYDSGTIAHANVNWMAPVKVRQILIGGSTKMIVYDDMQVADKIKVYDSGVSFTSDPAQIYQMRVGYRTGDMWAPKIDLTEALRFEGEHFVKCIEGAENPITDGYLGLRVVELIEAATSSMRGKGETVYIQRQGKAV